MRVRKVEGPYIQNDATFPEDGIYCYSEEPVFAYLRQNGIDSAMPRIIVETLIVMDNRIHALETKSCCSSKKKLSPAELISLKAEGFEPALVLAMVRDGLIG